MYVESTFQVLQSGDIYALCPPVLRMKNASAGVFAQAPSNF